MLFVHALKTQLCAQCEDELDFASKLSPALKGVKKLRAALYWKLQIVLTPRNKHTHLSYEVEIKLYTECRFIWWVCEELAYYIVSPIEIKVPVYHS